MWRKIVLLIALSFLLCSCIYSVNLDDSLNSVPTPLDEQSEDFQPNIGSGMYPDEMEFVTGYYYNGEIVQNADLAIALATNIFNNMEKIPEMENYIPQLVYLDTEDHLWIIGFWDKDQHENTLDGYYLRIILDAKTGAVKSIYSNINIANSVYNQFDNKGQGDGLREPY